MLTGNEPAVSCKGGKFRTEVVQEPGQAHVSRERPNQWYKLRGLDTCMLAPSPANMLNQNPTDWGSPRFHLNLKRSNSFCCSAAGARVSQRLAGPLAA